MTMFQLEQIHSDEKKRITNKRKRIWKTFQRLKMDQTQVLFLFFTIPL